MAYDTGKDYFVIARTVDGVYSVPGMVRGRDFERWMRSEGLVDVGCIDHRDCAEFHMLWESQDPATFDPGDTVPVWSAYVLEPLVVG